MKNILSIILIIFVSQISIQAQEISDKVADYILYQDSIVGIKNATLIDGTGEPVKYNQDIIIRNNKIISIEKTGKVSIPENAKIIDGTGKTIIPGLIMMHEHLLHGMSIDGNYSIREMPYTFPQLYLAGGVTTMRTAGGIEVNTDLNIKNMIDQGRLLGPSIDVSTPLIERAGTLDATVPQLPSLYANESIENWLNYWFAKGVTSVKVYNNVTKDDLRKILDFSHAKNIKVTGHLCSITYREAAEMGIDNLEHGFNVATDFVTGKLENQCVNATQSLMNLDENDPRLISLMKILIEKGITLTYTPNIREPNTNREVIPGGGDEALAPHLLKHFKASHDKAVNTQGDSLKLIAFKKEMKRIKKFHSLNGKLIVGTDPTGSGKTIPGYANQRLIELLVETGFSIEEAIKLSTMNGAVYMGIEKETGSIEVGKKADLVLMDGDLSENISNIRKMEIVFKNGTGYDSQKIFDSVKGKIGL